MNSRLYHFVVSGCGSFPFKLLQHDQAWPATAEDAEAIEFACPTVAPRVTLTLASNRRPVALLWSEAKWPLQKIES